MVESNVMLATRISLMNELANLADACGADIAVPVAYRLSAPTGSPSKSRQHVHGDSMFLHDKAARAGVTLCFFHPEEVLWAANTGDAVAKYNREFVALTWG